ncbi:MAG: hypothetical protein ACYTEZ_05660 [Planctomycetota bacterium]|jgi:hypothetical protein
MSKGLVLGLVMGVVAGFLTGWAIFGGSEIAPRRGPPRSVTTGPGAEGYRQRQVVGWPADKEERDAGERDPFLTSEAVRAASPDELSRLAGDADTVVSPDAIAALVARLDDARARRDWTEFRSVLTLLGRAGTPEAQRKLIALMGDPSLGFHRSPMGRYFFDWLKGSEVPGIVGAARARIEKERKENPASRAALRGWLALLAQHGSPSDLDWIETFEQSRGGDKAVIEAFVATAQRPMVADRVAAMFRDRERRWYSSHLTTLAKANPALARQLLEEGLQRPRPNEARDLARAYGEVVDAGNLEASRSFLLGLGDRERLSGVYAVERMSRKGLDVSGMEAITLAPVEALERLAQQPKPSVSALFEARYAIQHNRITWTERAAKAMEEAARKAPRAHAASLRAVARQIRAGIGSTDSEWVTK